MASLLRLRPTVNLTRLAGIRSFSVLGDLGIEKLGIKNDSIQVFRNLNYEELADHERKNNEGHFIANGTLAIDTGKFTGRSPKDKYIVKQSPSQDKIWWGSVNKPMEPQVFDELYGKVTEHYSKAPKMYVFDGYCGANPKSRKKVRIITEKAWQSHFVTNMFIRPQSKQEIEGFQPEFTIINSSAVTNPRWKEHGLNSDVFVSFNIERNVAIIGGTLYGGEMKKGIFSMMNYWLPTEGVMSMHCSANRGKNGDTALFFGLSGTGKTTLSADPHRWLIGDDEHGWDDDGIFNFEGGCYAKTIGLRREKEPEIYDAIKPNALLENVKIVPETNMPDYDDKTKTENGRVSYPIYHISNYEPSAVGKHPNSVVFLTCDAYGVLPPISVLTPEQAMYHFLSGYTAKVAGTERGIIEPQATFSACFGAAFLPLHPTVYAKLLQSKIEKHGSRVYLLNTGWSGGAYGVGSRMDIPVTRACVDAILEGKLDGVKTNPHPVFQVGIPENVPGVPTELLDPRNTWANKAEYDATAANLAQMFVKNYKQYQGGDVPDYSSHGPKV